MTNQPPCPTIEHWDRMLLSADKSDPKLVEHLQVCQLCQVTVAWRRELLGDLQAATAEAERQSLVTSGFYPLPEIQTLAPRVAAALSERAAVSSDNSVNLVSFDGSVLIKGVRDAVTDEVWLYVISEDPRYVKSVLVRPFGDDREFLTDENGRVNLGRISLSELSAGKVEVVLSQAVFRFEPFGESLPPALETTLQSDAGDSIKVSLIDIGTAREVRIDIIRLSRRDSERPLRIAIRDPKTGKTRLVTPSESFADGTFGRDTVELFLFQ